LFLSSVFVSIEPFSVDDHYYIVFDHPCCSVRMNDRVRRGDGDNKKIAFLMDAKTIAVLDFVTGTHVAVVNHDAKIDW
jgi:hypothetical protein